MRRRKQPAQRIFVAGAIAIALSVALAGSTMAGGMNAPRNELSAVKVSCSHENETVGTLRKFADWLKANGLSSLVNSFQKPVRAGKVRCIDIMKSMTDAV
jgi:hypothetical protein